MKKDILFMVRFLPVHESVSGEQIKRLSKKYDIHEAVTTILIARGITDFDNYFGDGVLYDPMLLNDMEKSVQCIKEHVDAHSKITVYGDYDADGVCSSAILYCYLKDIGADVDFFLPDRNLDGYGLNISSLDTIAENGTKLIVTVDCGITNYKEVEYIRQKGVEVVVSDHHQCPDILPKCAGVVNPLLGKYPYRQLCGAGVALKIVQAMGGKDAFDKYVDLAAVATVADLVPITGENRTIVKKGIESINSRKIREGVRALCDVCSLKEGSITSGQIAFGIAPRINAAGRMGSANTAFKLIVESDYDKASQYASELEASNAYRRIEEENVLCEAEEIISKMPIGDSRVIILKGENWNKGVIGIVASKIVDKYNRPVIVFSEENGVCVGSGRSIPGIHMFNLINVFGNMLIKYGGHEMAAGLSIDVAKLADFERKISDYARKNFDPQLFIPSVFYDCELDIKDVNLKLVEDLEKLAPTGMGNKTPVFKISGISLKEARLIGSDKTHIKMSAAKDGVGLDVVGFSFSDRINEINDEYIYDMVGSITVNTWNGRCYPQMQLKDFKPNLHQSKGMIVAAHGGKYFDSLLSAASMDEIKVTHDRIRQMWRWETYLSRRLKKDVMGSAIYTSIPTCSYELFSFLEKEGLDQNIDIYTGKPMGNSCVVMAPDWNEDVLDYSRLIVFDYAPTDFIRRVLEKNPGIQIVICNNDITDGFIERFNMGLDFERQKAKVYYSIINKICSECGNEDVVVKRFCKMGNETPFNAYFALSVFEELGFLKRNSGKIELCKSDSKKELSSSKVLCDIIGLKEKIIREVETIKPPRVSKGKKK